MERGSQIARSNHIVNIGFTSWYPWINGLVLLPGFCWEIDMYNIKTLLEQRKKLVIFLTLILIGLVTLGISLIPSMNYLTGENMANRAEFIIPAVYVGLYAIFALIIIGIIVMLSVISKKLYMVKRIDESIRGIKKGKVLEHESGPRREELLQSHFAEKIRATGMNTNRLKLFDRITDDERNSIIRYKIDDVNPNRG